MTTRCFLTPSSVCWSHGAKSSVPRCDGRALIDLAGSTRPDVIVLDISMPGLNGIDACAQIHQKMPGLRLVFLTVNEDPDTGKAIKIIRDRYYAIKAGRR